MKTKSRIRTRTHSLEVEDQPEKLEGPWAPHLQGALNVALAQMEFEGIPVPLREMAIQEVLKGTAFCVGRKLKLLLTLESDFDIADYQCCLIAKSSSFSSYVSGLIELDLPINYTEKLGFYMGHDMADFIKNLLGGLVDYEGIWTMIYNALWHSVGIFFRDHPEFGVS